MKVYEGQGPILQHIKKHTNPKKSTDSDFQKIMDQIRVQSEKTDKSPPKEGIEPVVNGIQMVRDPGLNNGSPVSTEKSHLIGTLRETLDMVDFYAAKLGDSSMPITDLAPLIGHLESRIDVLRDMGSVERLPERLKTVISDTAITIGSEIAKFKRGDYS